VVSAGPVSTRSRTAAAAPVFGHVDPDVPTVDGAAVHLGHGPLSGLVVAEGDEAESAGATSLPVTNDLGVDDLAVA